MLHQLLSAQFMVKAAWKLAWLYMKTTKQTEFVCHTVSPLCDTSTPPPRHTAPKQWGMRPRKWDFTLAGPGCKPWLPFISSLFGKHYLTTDFSKMEKYPSFKDCCKSFLKTHTQHNGCTASLLYSKGLGVPYCCIVPPHPTPPSMASLSSTYFMLNEFPQCPGTQINSSD